MKNPIAHPRPQLRRPENTFTSLDGPWRFLFDDDRRFAGPPTVSDWSHTIAVPYAPESVRSGIGDTGFHRCLWYERDFEVPPGEGLLRLHFGAVDYSAQVWVNGHFAGSHEGGHTPFTLELTPFLAQGSTQTVTVRVEDDPFDLAKPRGKQDWRREPHSIWYPRTTGIWQTVWVERVPATYLDRVRWTPLLERWEIGLEAFVAGRLRPERELELKVRLEFDDGGEEKLLAEDTYRVLQGEVHRRIAFSDPGIDDFRNEMLWSPEKPTLIRARLELRENGRVIDEIESYTALRSAAIHRDRFMLNGRPYFLRLVLDQGYWPETLMTAPSDEALREDIRLTKAMGFNGVRKHQKIEDPRYLYWADVMGLLVWEEMPSAYRFTHESVERLVREWTEVINRDYNHPCIVTWVPFNESWGVPDLAEKTAHQHCVQALYHLTKTLDPTRPVVGNDGWESSATDILGIHDYEASPERLQERYGPNINLNELFEHKRPGGRVLTLEGYPHAGMPIVLTEFGGIAYAAPEDRKAWGYSSVPSPRELLQRYSALLGTVNAIERFSGFCYTQLTDVFQEANGLLYADRRPKIPLEAIAAATLGRGHAEPQLTLPEGTEPRADGKEPGTWTTMH